MSIQKFIIKSFLYWNNIEDIMQNIFLACAYSRKSPLGVGTVAVMVWRIDRL